MQYPGASPTTIRPPPVVYSKPSPLRPTPPLGAQNKKHRNKKRKHKSGKGWSQLFCMDSPDFASYLPKSWWSPKSRRRRQRPVGTFEIIDMDGERHVSIADSEDWDLMRGAVVFKDRPYRPGPHRKKGASDIDITLRDLFPCMGDIFDFCGCSKPKKRRAHIVERSGLPAGRGHPALETVCLDCGHVLDHKHLNKSVIMDAHGNYGNWDRFLAHAPPGAIPPESALDTTFRYGYGVPRDEWNRKKNFDGYNKGWTYLEGPNRGQSTRREVRSRRPPASGEEAYLRGFEDRIPLPAFRAAEPRILRSRPGRTDKTRWAESDYYDVDDKGHVALPHFDVHSSSSSS